MIKKIVFFISSTLTDRDYKRFGVELLKYYGFEVSFFDFTPIRYRLLYEKGVFTDRRDEECFVFHDYKEAIQSIRSLGRECFVFCIMHYGQDTFKIYKALSRSKARYAIRLTDIVPKFHPNASQKQQLLVRLSKKSLQGLIQVCKNFAFRPVLAKHWGIRPPKLIIAGGVKSLESPHARIIGKESEVLLTHSSDYDLYLEYINNTDFNDGIPYANAVHIDLPGPRFLRDALAIGRTKSVLTEEKYYPSLCRFFDRVEKDLGVKVEIAAHPGTNHSRNPDYFGQRLTLRGKTPQMIMHAKFVTVHASTAISFAVLFMKPLIFITTDEIEAVPKFAANVHNMASWFGKTPINIDCLYDVDLDQELLINKARYLHYKNYFIKKVGSSDINSWETVAKRLKSM